MYVHNYHINFITSMHVCVCVSVCVHAHACVVCIGGECVHGCVGECYSVAPV